METEIKLLGKVSEEDSYALSKLAVLIEKECDTPVEQKRQAAQVGDKDGGLVIALTVFGLALSTVSTLVSVLSFWKDRQQEKQLKYSVSIVFGNTTLMIENLDPAQVESELAKLNMNEKSVQVQVLRQ